MSLKQKLGQISKTQSPTQKHIAPKSLAKKSSVTTTKSVKKSFSSKK